MEHYELINAQNDLQDVTDPAKRYFLLIFGAKMKLWLDDIRQAPEGWLWVKNEREFWRAMAKEGRNVEAISFDNDLGEKEPEGWMIARDLYNVIVDTNFKKLIYLTCHSANVPARKKIEGYISDIIKFRESYESHGDSR